MLYRIEVKRRGAWDAEHAVWNFEPDETAAWHCPADNVFRNQVAAQQVAELIRRDGFSVRIVEAPEPSFIDEY